jgi:hypothetical protein
VTEELLVTETRVGRPAAVLGMLHRVGFELVVSFLPRRVTPARIFGLPASARAAAQRLLSTPRRARGRLVQDFAKGAFTQRPLVTHSSR